MKRFLPIGVLLFLMIVMSNVQATTILWGDTLESKLDALNQEVENIWGTRMDVTEDQVTTIVDEISVTDEFYGSRLDAIEKKTDDLLVGTNVTGGITISSPGRYVLIVNGYTLTINIDSSDVTFDFNTFKAGYRIFDIRNGVDDVTVKNGVKAYYPQFQIENAGSNRIIIENILMLGSVYGLYIRGNDVVVNNCYIITGDGYRNILIEDASNVIITGCWLRGAGNANGIIVRNSSNVLIENCFVWGHEDSGHAIHIESDCSNVTVKNCVLRAPGASSHVILDDVPAGSGQSTVIGNFAYDCPNDVRYALLATNTEQGVALSYPPQDQQTNMWVNYYVAM